jgi:hypothetical protein
MVVVGSSPPVATTSPKQFFFIIHKLSAFFRLRKIGRSPGSQSVGRTGAACPRPLPWHKDCGQGGHSYYCNGLTVGISVTGADERSGALGVVPGSHRANVQTAGKDDSLDRRASVVYWDGYWGRVKTCADAPKYTTIFNPAWFVR